MSEPEGQFFDPHAELFLSEQHLPHWGQSGTITFVTMRLADSIPAEVVEAWDRERLIFLRRHNIDFGDNWRAGRAMLDARSRTKFDRNFSRMREDTLDQCRGNGELRSSWAAQVVVDSLLKFDEDRYAMGDLVVMHNHIHFLAAFRNGAALRKQCGQWMRFTARQINERSGRTGSLWYEEPFDHLVRSAKQLEYLRKYIEDNPRKAKLSAGEFYYRRSNRHF